MRGGIQEWQGRQLAALSVSSGEFTFFPFFRR